MKRSILFLFVSSLVLAQTQTPSKPEAASQQLKPRGPVAVAKEDPNRVVATANGQKVTAAQAVQLLQAIPPTEMQQIQRGGGGLSAALQQVLLMKHLSELATQQHLDQQDAFKSQLEFYRENMLAQAYVAQASSAATPSAQDIKNYYDQHSQQFQEAKISAIIVNFTPTGATPAPNTPGSRTEAQAKAKADDLVKKIRGGAQFAEVAKTDSDHKASADKGGQLGSYAPDKLPKEISDPVFKLKAGEVTDPVREASGYYILKLDSLDKKTFEQAQNDIVAQLKNDQVRKIIDQYQVQVQDSDFFSVPGQTGANTPSLNRSSAPGQPRVAASQ
jgi:hypothetical protein